MRASSWLNLAGLAIGLVGLVIVTHALGWSGIHMAIVDTGAWFGVIAVIDLAGICCDAFAIHGFLGRTVPYPKVFAAQASGLAINRLTPANSLGEPVKVTMLNRDTETTTAIAAIVMFNLTTMYAGIVAIVIGVPLTALLLDLPPTASLVAWIGLGVLVVFAIAIAVLVRRGAVGTIVGLLAKLRLISRERAMRWATQIDTQLRGLVGAKQGVAGVIGSRLCNWAGTVVMIHACGISVTAPLVIAMLSVGILVTWMSNIVPLGLGIADGTNYILYGLLGASPAEGLVYTMVNRVRTIVIALIGLTIMAIANAVAKRR
ncbi:MAG: lysylphosphatidylglycerol synthase transmembrane domain-containing protein [Kofleriaceae bacterium]